MTAEKSQIQEISEWIKSRRKFLITGHRRPDGDSLGSSLALSEALASIGKECTVIMADPVPRMYRELPGMERIITSSHVTSPGEFEGLIALECGNIERTGLQGVSSLPSLNIDHHPSTQAWADLNWIDAGFSAAGEMVFLLLEAMEIKVSSDTATSLFTAIMTDTGSFQYSNTTPQTFLIASRLVEAGASPSGISQNVYMNQRASRLRLLARVLSTLEIDSSQRSAAIVMTLQDLEESEARTEDTEGFVNYPLRISGIEACAFLQEVDGQRVRISLRSKAKVDVSSVAANFGGGGHSRAAGCTLEGISIQEAKRIILEKINSLL